MLLVKYDFYDMHWAIVMVRFKPLYEYNYEIASRIKDIIDAPQADNLVDINVIRKSLSEIAPIHNTDEWYWVAKENVYVYGQEIIDDPLAYQILSEGFGELLRCLKEQDENRIFAIADALHNIPIIFAENDKHIKRKIKFEISTYRRKWNRSFLKKELKL